MTRKPYSRLATIAAVAIAALLQQHSSAGAEGALPGSPPTCFDGLYYDAMVCDDGSVTPLDGYQYTGEDGCHLVTIYEYVCVAGPDPWTAEFGYGSEQIDGGGSGAGGGSYDDLNQYGKDSNRDGYVDCLWNLVDATPTGISSCGDFGGVCSVHPNGHNGIDLPAPLGASVFAGGVGKVVEAGEDTVYGNGFYVRLQHDGYNSVYIHLKADSITVSAGDLVVPGQKIGEANNTGSSQGNHLHVSLYTGTTHVGSGSNRNDIDPRTKFNANCGVPDQR